MSEFLRIVAPSVDVDLKVLMGEGAATPTGGIGGWQQVERPDAKSLTEWKGNGTITQDIPILINGYMQGNSVQGQANDIIKLGRSDDKDDEVPPVFRMSGPIWFQWLPWVLEGVDWGNTDEDVIRGTDNTLFRQHLVLHVAEYEDPDQIRIRRIRRAYGVGKGGGVNYPGNIYITHKGDNCNKIAAKVFGDRSRGKRIAAKNNIRDPNKDLPTGTRIRLPANPWAEPKKKSNAG